MLAGVVVFCSWALGIVYSYCEYLFHTLTVSTCFNYVFVYKIIGFSLTSRKTKIIMTTGDTFSDKKKLILKFILTMKFNISLHYKGVEGKSLLTASNSCTGVE